jgi:hypothetical protein
MRVSAYPPLAKLAEGLASVIETNLTEFHCSQEGCPDSAPKAATYSKSVPGWKNPFAGGLLQAMPPGSTDSRGVMLDHRYDNVRVTTICPGSVNTEFVPGAPSATWKIQPEDIADIVLSLLRLPARTLVSYVEVRPSQPKKG